MYSGLISPSFTKFNGSESVACSRKDLFRKDLSKYFFNLEPEALKFDFKNSSTELMGSRRE